MKLSFRPLAGMSCFNVATTRESARAMFPSPRGDELFQNTFEELQMDAGFRPLAGMSCFNESHVNLGRVPRFPSPRGDELFLKT